MVDLFAKSNKTNAHNDWASFKPTSFGALWSPGDGCLMFNQVCIAQMINGRGSSKYVAVNESYTEDERIRSSVNDVVDYVKNVLHLNICKVHLAKEIVPSSLKEYVRR